MKTIVFRADANVQIGLGHLSRCLALAGILKEDFRIRIAIQDPPAAVSDLVRESNFELIIVPSSEEAAALLKYTNEGDFIVLDGYNFNSEYQRNLFQKGRKIVCIDDLIEGKFYCDAIINHCGNIEPSNYNAAAGTKIFTGPSYAILKPEFLRSFPKKEAVRIDRLNILVAMGGADIHNLSGKLAKALIHSTAIEKISIVTGNVNPHVQELKDMSGGKVKIYSSLSPSEMATQIKESDITVCPPSTIAYETCSVGANLVTIKTAENQKYISGFLRDKELALCFDDPETLNDGSFGEKFFNFIRDHKTLNQQLSNQRSIFDHRSPERLRKLFIDLL